MLTLYKDHESAVRSYCRRFPLEIASAEGATLSTADGKSYIDFLAGAGALNYGHNPAPLKAALINYLEANGIAHSLDFHTTAKSEFLATLQQVILQPRGLDHVAQFTGPTGANAVEAALKLARKVTGRHNIVAFTNGFHGCSLGALACTGNQHHRGGAGINLAGVSRLPFAGYLDDDGDTLALFEKMLADPSSGLDQPAAVIVETVQGEGGLNVASERWLCGLAALCKRHDMLLIVDDIQAGCGRTGSFFSFEAAGIVPDIITLSKSLSGYGLPFALTLIRRELDQWAPGEHNGTFRGNNHAFVTATAALNHYWRDDRLMSEVGAKAERVRQRLSAIAKRHGAGFSVKGRGLMVGLACPSGELADQAARLAFKQGLIIETAGPFDEVLKVLAPLTIEPEVLERGLDILAKAVDQAMAARQRHAS